MKKQYLFIILLLVGTLSCGGNDPEPEIVAPSDLTVAITVSTTVQGNVDIQATANNTNYFDFDFGDGKSSTPLVDVSGKVSYTYSATGTYQITVRAYATANVFIEKIASATVTVDPGGGTPTTGYTTPDNYAGYDLVWQDEFNGTAVNTSDWTFEIGTGSNGWGNNELQYYRQENASVADGYLTITAKKENFGGQEYTSTRMITKGKKFFEKGRVDIRAVMPKGQGIWPALWMLGENISTVGWPACGEIDIMEMVGGGAGRDNTTHGTIHWDNNGQYASFGKSYTLNSGILADEFHVYTIIWDDTSIKWYMDDTLYNTVDITPSGLSEFHNNFFFIFNVAVGGNWPGSPNASTEFPQQMIVDYIRIFQPN